MYSALMIDLKASRMYSNDDRVDIQNYIRQAIELLNDMFSEELEREVEFSAGDELQGLFANPVSAYLYYRWFSILIHPVKFRAGIGVGTWDIRIENGGSTMQDGAVYHRARKAIRNADELEGYPILFLSECDNDVIINSLIGTAANTWNKLSSNQNDLLLLTELISPILSWETQFVSGDLTNFRNLIEYKSSLPIFSISEKNKERAIQAYIDGRINEIVQPIFVDPYNREFYITSGKQRGIPSRLSEIMGISRQSIEKTLKSSNIYTSRNMAITAIKVMLNAEKGER